MRIAIPKFNKEQREGLAKVCDNVASAYLIAAIVGGLIDHKVGWETGAVLAGCFVLLIYVGVKLRKGDEDAD